MGFWISKVEAMSEYHCIDMKCSNSWTSCHLPCCVDLRTSWWRFHRVSSAPPGCNTQQHPPAHINKHRHTQTSERLDVKRLLQDTECWWPDRETKREPTVILLCLKLIFNCTIWQATLYLQAAHKVISSPIKESYKKKPIAGPLTCSPLQKLDIFKKEMTMIYERTQQAQHY